MNKLEFGNFESYKKYLNDVIFHRHNNYRVIQIIIHVAETTKNLSLALFLCGNKKKLFDYLIYYFHY